LNEGIEMYLIKIILTKQMQIPILISGMKSTVFEYDYIGNKRKPLLSKLKSMDFLMFNKF